MDEFYDEIPVIPESIDVNINFCINPGNTNVSVSFHTEGKNTLTVEEYVDFFKRGGVALGFTEAEMNLISVANP